MLIATSETEIKAKLFRGLADPTRLSILESLRRGPNSVGDVVAATGFSQSNVSNHLACLKDCGLVESRREGRHVYYRIRDSRVSDLLRLAEGLLSDVAQGVYACTRYTPETDDAIG